MDQTGPVAYWFKVDHVSPGMPLVIDSVKDWRKVTTGERHVLFGILKLHEPHSDLPAVGLADHTARVETERPDTNSRCCALIGALRRRTGCPVILQQQLQRARRADRRFAGGHPALLHGYRAKALDSRQLLAEGSSAGPAT